ncbi:MAG: hypothetical protein QTN59_12650 [Candidatus Electrothrix communis]|nr:MAG: hypothetical protein QTN59_10775 [Candidatus Electrothrix communis]WLE95526.1 MAG: hypothetical protein QTN59_12650 [Candidatus Electrothrix communis]
MKNRRVDFQLDILTENMLRWRPAVNGSNVYCEKHLEVEVIESKEKIAKLIFGLTLKRKHVKVATRRSRQ